MLDVTPKLLAELRQLHPADLADRLQRLSLEEAQQILPELPSALAARALAELEPDRQRDILIVLPVKKLSPLLAELPANLVADLVPALPPAVRRMAFDSLPAENRQRVQALLRYAPDTVGGIMNDRFISLLDEMTVDQVRELLRAHAEEERTEDVAYLYVTDAGQHLVGIVSLRDLVFRRSDRCMREIMNRDVKSVRVNDDQEKVAQQFEHYHYLGLPVLDAEGRIVGVVKASDAMEIVAREATEDMQLMVGLSGEERSLTPWQKSIGRRLPWLCINLATAFAAGAVVSLFESTIAKWTALAIFLPIVAGQGGNAGMQTLTVIVRDMALGELSPGDGRKALFKEAILGLFNGVAIGLLVGVVAYFWQGSLLLGAVVGVAMLLNLLAAALSGVLIPFGLKFCKVDPALASSIFVTTVTDVAGFFFFLGLAALAIRWFGI